MTILRVGSNEQYANNWAEAFGEKPKKKSSKSAAKATAKKKTAKKKSAKKKS